MHSVKTSITVNKNSKLPERFWLKQLFTNETDRLIEKTKIQKYFSTFFTERTDLMVYNHVNVWAVQRRRAWPVEGTKNDIEMSLILHSHQWVVRW